jgi:Ser/Thr protein kinase RdoA (MazF antagonist)
MDLFPVTYSTLSPTALLAEVAQTYTVDAPVSCRLLKRGLNDTYLVTTGDDRYIARVYRARWRSPSEIAYELELLAHLTARGVSVSMPIAARDGSLMRPLHAPEGLRYLVLFTYASGTPLAWEKKEHSCLAGRLLAAIHTASDDFVSRHERLPLDLRYLIDTPLAALQPFFAHRPDDWSYLKHFGTRLRERAEDAVQADLDWGVCHGDFGAKNIHVQGDHMCTIYDFDLCGPGWRAYDLALIAWVVMDQNKSTIWDAFVKGYTETRPLAAADLAAVPLFHVLCHLSSLGVFAENVGDWGILDMSDWLLDRELTFFREWEVEHLEGKRRVTNGG